MNRLTSLFQLKNKNVLAIYLMAGYPNLHDTKRQILELAAAGADLIEIGMPFSDPLADGKTIQAAAHQALQNGMSLRLLFEQLEGIRQQTEVPLVLMGYLNPVLQFGVENFCRRCREVGVDGVILPDLPLLEFEEKYAATFAAAGLSAIFLVTPETAEERVRAVDKVSNGFVYAVSASATTGGAGGIQAWQTAYFQRLASLNLKNPVLVGFGISDRESFAKVCEHLNGAVVGSAFLRAVEEGQTAAAFLSGFGKPYRHTPVWRK